MVNRRRGGSAKSFAAFRGLLLSVGILFVLSGCGGSSPTFIITGTVTAGGSALSGVTVTLTGGTSGIATTDANGMYSFGDIPQGTYTLTPSIAGYTFSPPTRTVFLDGLDAIGFNFSAVSEQRLSASTHTIFLETDGTLRAWGKNANGQLGNGTTTDSIIPVRVSGLSNVIAIASGYDHSAALNGDGTVWTWGKNANGQLGNGTTTDSVTPVQVSGLSEVTDIAAGNGDTLALKIDSTVWAWGSNDSGQLGDGTTIDKLTPVKVSFP